MRVIEGSELGFFKPRRFRAPETFKNSMSIKTKQPQRIHVGIWYSIWWFPEFRGTSLGVPIIRSAMLWAYIGVPRLI